MREGWPFWAPSDADTTDRALALAQLRPGDHLVDLGCGDGRVLVMAAGRGARVTGVECDPVLVEQARAALVRGGAAGEVVHADIFQYPLEAADVVFTYLSPATLQRLVPHLHAAPPGMRLVTIDYGVPGLSPRARDGSAFLYELPPRVAPWRGRTGWPTPGALVAAPSDRSSLTCLELRHPGGGVRLSLSLGLRRVGTFRAGTDRAAARQPVAIDLRWAELPEGTLASGFVRVPGLPPYQVTVLFTEETEGVWELSADACTNLTARLRRPPPPVSFDELLSAASSTH